MRKILIVFCLVFSATFWPLVTIAQTPTIPAPSEHASDQETLLLKAKLETMEQYQDQFISMVQWSFGAVFAMALGLAAFNWYSSKVSYDRDIQSLHLENKTLRAELLALLKKENDVASKRLANELSDCQSNIQAAVTKDIKQQLADHKNKLLELDFTNTQREAKDAVNEKRYTWGIYKYCQLLRISVRQGSDRYEVSEILDTIGELISKPNTSLDAENVTNAVETLKNLPERYQAAAENLISKITAAHK